MSERRRRKNPRFLKETSDRSGFDNWSRTDEGNFVKKWQSVKQGGLLLEPDEYDTPPPSNRPLGGADISGSPNPAGDSYAVPTESQYQVQYLSSSSQITMQEQSPIMITGSNSAVSLGNAGVIASSGSNNLVSLLCVGSNVPLQSYNVFVDSETTPKTVTDTNYVELDTNNYVTGTASGKFDGTNYLSLASSSDWAFSSSNFTIEGYFNFSLLPSGFISLLGHFNSDINKRGWLFAYSSSNLYFFYSTDGITPIFPSVSFSASEDRWYHLAFVRSGNNGYFFINGVRTGAAVNFTGITIFDAEQRLAIGSNNIESTPTQYFYGNIDMVRISDIARWTDNFTPPTTAYTADSNTKLLLNFDSASGLKMNTRTYSMDSGAILNLRYDTSDSSWYETSRDHQYYSLGAL